MSATPAATIDAPPAAPTRAARMSSAPMLAQDALAQFVAGLCAGNGYHDETPTLDLSQVAPDVVAIIDDALGEGGVVATIAGANATRVHETLFAGVWRVRTFGADGSVVGDRLEAAPLPRIVVTAARDGGAESIAVDRARDAPRAAALLATVAAKMHARRHGAYVVNVTLSTLSAGDRAAVDAALSAGRVRIVVRGFGTCRIASTLARDVWRVDYASALDRVVLQTIEVVEVPEIALAAPEDIDDSRIGLAELVEWLRDAHGAHALR